MKINVTFFVIAICLLLNACSNNSEIVSDNDISTTQPVNSSANMLDAQNKYLILNALSFQETSDYFCGSNIIGNHLYYYDKNNGSSGLLCADPSCTHSDSSCSAYCSQGTTMFLYNGLRYWITKDSQNDGVDAYLWKGDISGANQVKVKCLSLEELIIPYQPQYYAIHRGNLFFLGSAEIINGTTPSRRITLMYSSLDDSETFEPLFDQTYDEYATAVMRFVDNYLYLSVCTYPEGGPYSITILKIDLTTNATEVLYEETGSLQGFGNIWVTELHEMYIACGSSLWKIESGQRLEIATFTEASSLPLVLDGIALNTYMNSGVRWVEIKDFSGDTIYHGKLFTTGVPEITGGSEKLEAMSMGIIGGDNEKIIISLFEPTKNQLRGYTLMLDLHSNLMPTLLWQGI